MYETFITDNGLAALAGMSELSKLRVRGTGVTGCRAGPPEEFVETEGNLI